MKMKKKDGFIVVFVALITAAITLLFAPNSGKVTRQKIKFKAKDMKDSLDTSKDHLIQDFKTSYFEAVDEVEQEFSRLDERQQQLQETISSIENELTH